MVDKLFTDAQRAEFEERGYAYLGRVLEDDALGALQERIDAIMLGEVPYEHMRFQLDSEDGVYGHTPAETMSHKGPTLSYRKIMDLEQDPLFLRYMQHPLFRQITDHYIGEDVSIFRAMFMNKPAERGTELPWHQDVGWGWGVDTTPTITVWTALDPSTKENGCMQVVPGSHKHGVIAERHFPSPEELARYAPEDEVVDIEAAPGEVILLHNLLLHRSGTNPSGQSRRAFSIAYMDGATRSRSTGAHFPMIFGADALVA